MFPAAKPPKLSFSSRVIALGGLLTALSWIFLALAVQFPQTSLFLRLLAALTLLVAERSIGLLGTGLIYVATALLTLLFPGPYLTLPYLIYFAPYVLFAFWSTSKLRPRLAVGLRVLIGCGLFLLVVHFYGDQFFPEKFREQIQPYKWALLTLLGILGTSLYDYFLALASLAIDENLMSKIKK